MRNGLLDIFNLRTNSFERWQGNAGELAASPDDQNSAGEIAILTDLNTNEGARESLDCDVSDDAKNEGDAEPDENVRRAEISKSNLYLALPDNKEIIENWRTEGWTKVATSLLLSIDPATRLSQNSKAHKQLKPTQRLLQALSKVRTFIQGTLNVEDIYSFIEIKVKNVSRLEIEKLKLEASSSYSNETI